MFIISKLAIKIIAIFPLLLLLNACGGGDESESFLHINPDADAAYSGNHTPALLDQNNTVIFAELIFGTNRGNDTSARPEANTSGILKNQPAALELISNIIIKKNTNNSLKGRRVQDSENCEYGGSVSSDALIEEGGGESGFHETTGTINYIFNNCEDEEGIVIHGKTFTTVHSEYPDHYTVGYDNLTFTENGDSYSLTGTQERNLGDYYPYSSASTTINLSVRHLSSDVSTYIKDYIYYTTPRANVEDESHDTITGQLFLSSYGYVSLSYSEDFHGESPTSSIPAFGSVYFSGAAGSSARASDHLGYILENSTWYETENGLYKLYLDQGGDGSYEYYVLQDASSANSNGMSRNQPPIPVLEAIYSNFPLRSPIGEEYTYGDTDYTSGQYIVLSGEKSEDLEDDDFTYEWKIESTPNGSNASLRAGYGAEASYDNLRDHFATLYTDIAGNYSVSLTVTDPYGSQEKVSTVIDLELSDPVYIGPTELSSVDISCSGGCNWDNKTLIVNEETTISLISYDNIESCSWFVEQQISDEVFGHWYWGDNGESITFAPLSSGNYDLHLECENSLVTRLDFQTILTAIE